MTCTGTFRATSACSTSKVPHRGGARRRMRAYRLRRTSTEESPRGAAPIRGRGRRRSAAASPSPPRTSLASRAACSETAGEQTPLDGSDRQDGRVRRTSRGFKLGIGSSLFGTRRTRTRRTVDVRSVRGGRALARHHQRRGRGVPGGKIARLRIGAAFTGRSRAGRAGRIRTRTATRDGWDTRRRGTNRTRTRARARSSSVDRRGRTRSARRL